MKKAIITLTAFLAIAMSFTACKKADPTPATPTSPTPVTPTVSGVNGAMISLQMDFSYTNSQVPIPITLQSEMGVAVFYNGSSTTTYLDAGTVSVNSNNLDKAASNSYTKMATIGQTPADLSFASGSSWSIGGSGSVTAFTYSHSGSFPSFSGTLPTTITKSAGLTISISSQTSGADSVYVLLAAGSQSLLKHVSASAGTATFSAAELAAFPTVTDNSAIIEVDPFKVKTATINGKLYGFVKEYAKIGSANIN